MLKAAAPLLALASAALAAVPCEWSGALTNSYVGSSLGATFSTSDDAIAACNLNTSCTGVTSEQRGAAPWSTRAGQVQGGTPGTGTVVSFAMLNAVACGHVPLPLQVGFHNATFDEGGNILPPAVFNYSVQRAMDASVVYYASAPPSLFSHGLPPWVWSTFTNGDYVPTSTDIVAAMSDGLGVLGYVKYVRRARAGRGGANETAALQSAIWLAEYLTKWATTWPVGAWPSVARSTGVNTEWPLNHSAQHDANSGQNCIETDKVGIVGFALLELHDVAGEAAGGPYFAAALHHARVLAANMHEGNATDAPWPWRVDSVTGAALWGRKNANMVFNLRLFRALAAPPYSLPEFEAPAAALWSWVLSVLIPSADPAVNATDSMLVNFYEDRPFSYAVEVDRTSWPALMLANYLLEQRDALDAQWQAHVEQLVGYALTLFGHPMFGACAARGEWATTLGLAAPTLLRFFLTSPLSTSPTFLWRQVMSRSLASRTTITAAGAGLAARWAACSRGGHAPAARRGLGSWPRTTWRILRTTRTSMGAAPMPLGSRRSATAAGAGRKIAG